MAPQEKEGEVWRGIIESLSQDGLGVGSAVVVVDAKEVRRPIFIPYTVPGDEVEVTIIEQRGKYLFGAAQQLLKASPDRVAPPCPHFGICGGCNLEHLAYEAQLREKATMTAFLLKRKGINLPYPLITLPSKERHNYRWRSRIAVRMAGGKVIAGFRKACSHEIVPITTCFVVAKEIVDLIATLNAARYDGEEEELEITVTIGESRKLGLLIPLDDAKDKKALKLFFDSLFGERRKLVANLFFEEGGRVKTAGQVQEHLTYPVAGFHFSFLPKNFIQANVSTNETLIGTVVDYVTKADGGTGAAIDLYAGIGNLSLPLAKHFQAVVSVEGEKRSSQLGAINAARNRLGNVIFLNKSVERYLHEYVRYNRKGRGGKEYLVADVILLDPPRTGCTEAVVEGLLRSGAPRIVYVSCNPTTLARDLAGLAKRYFVAEITCIDMFPDISHVETVVLLARKG